VEVPVQVLFVAALPEESRALERHVPVLHLGVGKVQAAATLGARLADDPADLVVNLGTAGGLRGQHVGDLVEIGTVLQHDFDHEAIGRFVGRPVAGGPLRLDGPPGASGRLATGDRVIVADADRAALAAHADVVDMEGYAVAATALAHGRDVWLVKAVSDGADADAIGSWRGALEVCGERLAAWAEGHGLLG
jgi:adenosylhomocysteine nucleosidase